MRKLGTHPFIPILAAAVAGIIAANLFELPLWFAAGALLLSYILGAIRREDRLSAVYFATAVASLFFIVATLSMPASEVAKGERVLTTMKLIEKRGTNGRWQNFDARLISYRKNGEWIGGHEKVILYIDTTYSVESGRQIAGWGYFNDLGEGSYANLMYRRGYGSRFYLVPGNLVAVSENRSLSPVTAAQNIREKALQRLERLGLNVTSEAIAAAMTLGLRQGLDRETRENYTLSGTAHILAISGLHVGMVFMIVNLLLMPLTLLNRFHIFKNILAVAILWLYAFVTGLSPSVIRATIMFTGTQAALASSSSRNSINTLLAAAAIMLLINPNYLYDMSFQLSFVAVLFIILWMRLLHKVINRRINRVLKWAISFVAVSVFASFAVAPLTALHFDYFSTVGLLINPLIVCTAWVIVVATLVWMILPLGIAAPLFRLLINIPAGIQDSLVGWGASRSWAGIETSIPWYSALLIYAVYLSITILLYNLSERKREFKV